MLYFPCRHVSLPSATEGFSMSLHITESVVEGVTLLALSGRLATGGATKIVLNMADIDYIDSSGLGTLVAAHLSAKTAGASVLLCNLGHKFNEVMQLTKLITVFDVYDTEAAAVGSFATSRAAGN